MTTALQRLLLSNTLARQGDDSFEGVAHVDAGGRIYGGEILSQAIGAAQQTVEDAYSLHKVHADFLIMGKVSEPVNYRVDRLRDGKSFVSRVVTARQHGEAIFQASMSFHRQREGVAHRADMPEAPAPETLVSDAEIYRQFLGGREYGLAVEFFQADPIDLHNPQPKSPVSLTWFRACGEVPRDHRIHQQLLAYASDNPIMIAALKPHGLSLFSPDLQMATLNHTLWFHHDFRMDDWLLFEAHSDFVGGGLATARARIFTRSGELVASAVQEGLMRYSA